MPWCEVFAKVVQTAWNKSRHRPWLCCPQGPSFIIRLCSMFGYHVWNPMFETEMLAPPQPSYYTNQMEICWSGLPCTYTRLGFQLAVSLKHIFEYWILATHFWGGQSLGKVTGSFQPTSLIVSCVSEILYWQCTGAQRQPLVFNQYTAVKPWAKVYHCIFMRTPYTVQSHHRVMPV